MVDACADIKITKLFSQAYLGERKRRGTYDRECGERERQRLQREVKSVTVAALPRGTLG